MNEILQVVKDELIGTGFSFVAGKVIANIIIWGIGWAFWYGLFHFLHWLRGNWKHLSRQNKRRIKEHGQWFSKPLAKLEKMSKDKTQ